MYKVTFTSYCGMSNVPQSFDALEDARNYAAQRLSSLRRRFKIATLQRGKEWEVLEPENAIMVPDACGILYIQHCTWACRECGCEHETSEDAVQCCTFEHEWEDDAERDMDYRLTNS